jgi:hypothetical protein
MLLTSVTIKGILQNAILLSVIRPNAMAPTLELHERQPDFMMFFIISITAAITFIIKLWIIKFISRVMGGICKNILLRIFLKVAPRN